MATVTSYSTLTQAIADYTHRADLTAGGTPLSDYFIQGAIEQIQQDIPDQNFGNYIRAMESAYAPSLIQGGVLPVPADWLGPKQLTVSNGAGNTYPMAFKNTAWLYARYPTRQPQGMPAYVSRDFFPGATITASLNTSGVLAVTATGAPLTSGLLLSDNVVHLPATTPGNAVVITGQTSGAQGNTGSYTAVSINPLAPTFTVASETMTAGGSVLIFGPYPDSNYQVQGIYYATIPALSSGTPANWLTNYAPGLLTAACLIEAARFINDTALLGLWQPKYDEKLKAMVDADKAERWAAGTMAIEIA